jgi:hypothetical protein
VARKTSRKRRKTRRPAAGPAAAGPAAAGPAAATSARSQARGTANRGAAAGAEAGTAGTATIQRGYARSRARDEAARAALTPLAPGERPTVVTVGAVAAALLALANLAALLAGWDFGPGSDDDEGRAVVGSLLSVAVLAIVAAGMWRARYWAVLGMQTLLAITIVLASLGLVTATSAWAALLLVLIIGGAGTLFWFMVKAMARIQMPARPGARSRSD